MALSPEQFEASLERLRREVRDPRAGLFGPETKTWELAREAVCFLGGGRASLLQLAHPFVAQAVAEHSATMDDPAGRFARTFEQVFAMVFGDLDAAIASARRVYRVHRTVVGTFPTAVGPFAAGSSYEANHAGAQFWVAATLWDTTVQVFELCVRPLSSAEKTQYYAEAKRFAALFAIPEEVIPASWDDFQAYLAGMYASGTLTVGPAAAQIGQFLMRAPHPIVGPFWRWYVTMTVGLLPPSIRAQFGAEFGPGDRAVFDASARALRATVSALPQPLRTLPAYRDAMARLGHPVLAGTPLDRMVDKLMHQAARRSTRRGGRNAAA